MKMDLISENHGSRDQTDKYIVLEVMFPFLLSMCRIHNAEICLKVHSFIYVYIHKYTLFNGRMVRVL